MADVLQAASDQLKSSYDDRTSTPANNYTSKALTHGRNTYAEQVHPKRNGQLCDAGRGQPTNRVSFTDLTWLDNALHEDYPMTSPIDVPRPRTERDGGDWVIDNNGMAGEIQESIHRDHTLLEDLIHPHRPSVASHPELTLESAHRRALEEVALPKSAIDAKPLDQGALHKTERYQGSSNLLRIHSEADVRGYDRVTGEPLQRHPGHFAFGLEQQQPIRSLFSSDLLTPVEAQYRRGSSIPEQVASLTSEYTASPITETQTPPGKMDVLPSPVAAFPPFAYPTSLEDSSAWPMPRRQASASGAKSYNLERKPSMRQARRQGSSRRSTSSSASPATTFLSRFAREEATPEPDSAGQQVGDYVLGKQVGYGGFSVVKEAFTLEGGDKICRAAKVVRKQLPGKDEAENDRLQVEFEHEVQLWRCLGHRNILPLIEVYDTDFATFCFTKLTTGGTLFDKVRVNRHGLSRDLARRYAYQLASAIRYLHEDVRIVHRDIKLENCLIDLSDPDTAQDGGNVLLCDFGLAEFATNDDMRRDPSDPYQRATHGPLSHPFSPSEASQSVAGSLQYASPELILSPAGFLSPVVDIWAFGVVIYALLVGDLPFQHVFQPRVRMMILAGEWNIQALEAAQGVVGYEDEVLEFIHGCLNMRSEIRWTIAQVLSSRWLIGMQEMLEEIGGSFKL
ncbi:MAG: hypothetical protein Q9163_000232 [Psora crenata]